MLAVPAPVIEDARAIRDRLRELRGFGEKTEQRIVQAVEAQMGAGARFKLAVAAQYAHALATYYVKTASKAWSVYAAVDGTALPAAVGTLTFKPDGSLNTAAPALPFPMSVTPNVTSAAAPAKLMPTFVASNPLMVVPPNA